VTGRAYDGFVPGRHGIDAYGNGGFRFAEMSHRGSILALPSGIKAWPVTTVAEITAASLEDVFAEAKDLDFMLIGTGIDLAPIPEALRWRFRDARIGLDVMQTGAAARTYHVMVREDRKVGAALIAVA
jgi:uncharacterized protein